MVVYWSGGFLPGYWTDWDEADDIDMQKNISLLKTGLRHRGSGTNCAATGYSHGRRQAHRDG